MDLTRYIKGIRTGKDIHRLEREAMSDPFLADALDGYNAGYRARHSREVAKLTAKIKRKTKQPDKRNRYYYWAAASIALLTGTGALWLFNVKMPFGKIQISQTTENQGVMDAESAAETLDYAANETEEAEENEAEITKIANANYRDEPVLDENIVSLEVKIAGLQTETVKTYGFETVNVPIDSGRIMLVALKESEERLNELVVSSTGRASRSKISGAVSIVESIDEDENNTVDNNREKSPAPQPVTGKKAYNNYLKNNLITPTGEDCKNKKGKVTLQFSVDKNGRPENITVIKSLCPSSDNEAIRLIKAGADWTQGKEKVKITVKF
jgi:hypothetical protein